MQNQNSRQTKSRQTDLETKADLVTKAPTCIVIGDVLLYRNGLAAGLTALNDVNILGSCGSSEASARIHELQPMVIVLDVTHHEILDQLSTLTLGTTIHVVGFGIHDRSDAVRCAEAGISAFVGRDETIEDLNKAVLKAVRGEAVCSARMMARLVTHLATQNNNQKPKKTTCLTKRENEVAALVNEGLSNKEIARQLEISPATVKNHVHMILEKFHIRRRGVIGRHLFNYQTNNAPGALMSSEPSGS